jgi:hypothetical protein
MLAPDRTRHPTPAGTPFLLQSRNTRNRSSRCICTSYGTQTREEKEEDAVPLTHARPGLDSPRPFAGVRRGQRQLLTTVHADGR